MEWGKTRICLYRCIAAEIAGSGKPEQNGSEATEARCPRLLANSSPRLVGRYFSQNNLGPRRRPDQGPSWWTPRISPGLSGRQRRGLAGWLRFSCTRHLHSPVEAVVPAARSGRSERIPNSGNVPQRQDGPAIGASWKRRGGEGTNRCFNLLPHQLRRPYS